MIRSIPHILRRTLLCLAGATMIQSAQAQFRYVFKDTTTAYSALSSPTSLNGSTLWDGDQYTAPIPFTWKLDSVNSLTSVLIDTYLPGVVNTFTSTTSVTGFIFGPTYILDRGTTTSQSPISYLTTGTSPNRIFKLEFKNAGFGDDPNGTDYFDLQMWIYETSNIVEYHFGASNITTGSDYFYTGAGPLVGLMQDADIDNGSAGKIYFIDGTVSPKTIDTIALATSTGAPSNVLSAWPSSGTVFRFTPRTTSCAKPTATFTSTSQSALSVRYAFTAPITGLDSLIWEFGDGMKQKVTTAMASPISHVYITAGRYNAKVTAYNKCGSTVSTVSEVKVSVADIPGLDNVKVYPTVADDAFIVEGLTAGGKITLHNQAGQLVQEVAATGGRQTVSVAELPAGIYSVQMTSSNGQGSTRIVKR